MQDKQPRVLHVDGDSRVEEEVTRLLRSVCADCDISVIDHGRKAIEKFRSEHFDLVILDAWVQAGNGFEICRRIRESDRNVPIIFYAVLAGQNAKGFAERAGATAFHTSESPSDFIDSVSLALNRKK